MVGPIAYNAQAQIPAANTFQPGGTQGQQQGRIQEEDQQQTRPAGTQAAQSQETETRNNGREESIVQTNSREDDNGASAASTDRGTTVDISV